jgi:hypothetical protein
VRLRLEFLGQQANQLKEKIKMKTLISKRSVNAKVCIPIRPAHKIYAFFIPKRHR